MKISRWGAPIPAMLAAAALLGACAQPTQTAPATPATAPTSAPIAAPAEPPAATTLAENAVPSVAATAPAAGATAAATAFAPAAMATVGAATGAGGCPPDTAARQMTGAGATFPAPLYTRWFAMYKQHCGVEINYQAIGSGGGIKAITEQTVDFGASDGILTADQFKAAPGALLMIPTVAGAEAVIVNLDGVQSGQLKLTPDTLSKIYLGAITRWDDPAIKADNGNLTLPGDDITVVHRSDGSGTTFIFTDYLSKVSPDWKSAVGAATAVQWPTGVGGQGNAGVAGQVKQIPGAIGYVELAYAVQNQLPWAAIKNQGGQFVEPTLQATTVAMNGVDLPDDMQVMLTNSADPQAYPIAGFTWVLAYKDQPDAARAQSLAHFLWWATHDGQQVAADLQYAPLSAQAVARAEALIKQITANGQPVIE